MKRLQIMFLAVTIIFLASCSNDTDTGKSGLDSIGNPTPNPKHTDTLRSAGDTVRLADSIRREKR